MLSHRIEEEGGAATLHLSGDLTITHGEELRTLIAAAMVTFDSLVLDLGEVKGMDLCALQIFCAAHRAASEQGRTLAVHGEGCGIYRDRLKTGGFSRHTGCLCDTNGTCLWIEGGPHG